MQKQLRVGDAVVGSGLTRSLAWRIGMLIPKGLSQAAKNYSWSFYTR